MTMLAELEYVSDPQALSVQTQRASECNGRLVIATLKPSHLIEDALNRQ
ncbi:MAG: hypothetical protein WCG06_05925 [Candidatus Omnitrophota bacterium]